MHEPIDEFDAVLDEIRTMHRKKMQDYGSNEDPYQNVVNSQLWGVLPWVGASIRIGDKEKRLQEYAKGKDLANETAEDSALDNCVYNVIRLILMRREHAYKG
jgi:hypothetical protein